MQHPKFWEFMRGNNKNVLRSTDKINAAREKF